MSEEVPRLCREVRRVLHDLGADGEPLPAASGWTARVVRAHVKRCPDCAAELARQSEVASGLTALRQSPLVGPPPDLLNKLLAQAERAGWRSRATVPLRGAVSGARPHLSIALLAVGTVAGTGAGYAAWRGVQRVRRRR